ncbi:glycosyltransferase [Coleofasciculus sp.]|uniref:glycosyltransferase n=1 Tax=Coleofasciculus sp. TaxID=3100458 RepID=UPI0039F83A88
MMKQKGMLLVLPVPFRAKGNQLFFEFQACHGLEQWADNFEFVVVVAPLIPESLAEQNTTMVWRDTATLSEPKRFELVPLPWAYSLPKFLSCYRSGRKSLAELISRCHYLQFVIGGLIGDWAAVAALEAKKQGRAYAIHTDRVEYEIMLEVSKKAKLPAQIKAKLLASLMFSYHKWIIKNCALGLWQGGDCYAAYASFCDNSHLIYDIHLKASDNINDRELGEKVELVANEPIIRICYAGRIDPMKAPLDWVQAIGMARQLGVNLHATWIGDGKLLDEMKALIGHLGLNSCIELVGFEPDRDKLLKRIRESHLMLFTHVTQESPRCLIESLVCGTPIIGYQSKYSEELIKEYGGGILVPMKNWKQLGELLNTLFKKRHQLSKLIKEAAINGRRFNDEVVFRERSELIKKYLD